MDYSSTFNARPPLKQRKCISFTFGGHSMSDLTEINKSIMVEASNKSSRQRSMTDSDLFSTTHTTKPTNTTNLDGGVGGDNNSNKNSCGDLIKLEGGASYTFNQGGSLTVTKVKPSRKRPVIIVA